MNAKRTINLPRISWRDDRPRFEPSPTLRALGFRGEDLRHDDGRWFSEGECLDWLREVLGPRLASVQAARQGGKPLPLVRPALARPVYTLAQMFADLWKRPEFAGVAVADGKRRRKPLARKTVRWYQTMADLAARHDVDIWAADATRMDRRMWARFIEEIEKKHGLDTARGVRATLSMAFARMDLPALKGVNPVAGVKLPMPEPRLRVGEIAEMRHLVAAADAMGRPEVGDAIMLGLFTGQRQADRLALTGGQMVDGDIFFRQQKTSAVVLIPAVPQLVARLAAARQRREGHTLQWPHAVIDEKINRPFAAGGDHYRHIFAEVRDVAAKTMPSLAGFRDQDLRDTAVTWLANAQCTVMQIASITGHSLQSIHLILRHYLASHPDQARAAIGNLVAWLEKKDAGL